jgi:23S rRNA (uracil1939-C5)-methyltransferase
MRSKNREQPRQYAVTIERLSHEGRGVAHFEGKTVFVADALPGEQIVASVVRRHRRFDEAVAVSVLRADPARVTPRCPHAAQCGGCALQHLEGPAQIAHKQAVLLEFLQHQAHVQPAQVLPPITGPLWGYRRRARLSVRLVPKKGGVLIGFREKATHYVTEINQCDVLVPGVGTRLPALRAMLDDLSIKAQIPQIEVAADDTHTLLLIRHLAAPSAADLARLRAFEAATGLHLYLQAGAAADSVPVGRPVTLEYRLGDLAYAFRPGDFVQVNAAINQQLVAQALALLAPEPHERVLDLFCGLGNFTLPLARRAGQVLGLEGDTGLVARARDNARANALNNVEFEMADLFSEAGVRRAAAQPSDRILLDPPRSGAEQVLRALDLTTTRRIVYVSCNPVTLARDTAILTHDRKFTLSAAGVIDMFPHTAHVESIAVFDRAR